jgi:hypothetical protein
MHGFPFHIIFLLTSAGRTGKPISMAEDSNDAFSSKDMLCYFGVSLRKLEFTGSVTQKSHQNEGVVCGFPAKLGEPIQTHISAKSRDIGTKFEL